MPHEIDPDTLEALEDQTGEPNGDSEVKPEVEVDPEVEVEPKDDPEGAEDEDKPDEDIELNVDDEEEEIPVSPENKALDEKLKEAGFDVEALSKQIIENGGEIPEDVIKQAKEKLDPDLVDANVARLRAEIELQKIQASEKYKEFQESAKKVQAMNDYIYKSVGGEDKFKSLADTLKGSMNKAALDSINAKLLSGNKTLVNEALKSAVSEYKKLKGIGGKRMEGDANAPAEKELRVTKEDYRAIMKTEKYKTDPLYRNKVDAARLKTRQADQNKYGPGMYYGMGQNGRYEL